MKSAKYLGVWMDHSKAHIMELAADAMETRIIESTFTHEVKEETLSKNENLMHNKEQHQQAAYFKQLGEVIKKYDEVLLFGPTEAKNQLFNLLRADHLFENIKIDIKQTGKLTEHQERAFVKEHFTK